MLFLILKTKLSTVADRRLPSSPRAFRVLKYIAQLSENLIHQRLGKNNSGYASRLLGQEKRKVKSVLRNSSGKVSLRANHVNALVFQSLLPGSLEEHQLVRKKARDTEHPGKGSFPSRQVEFLGQHRWFPPNLREPEQFRGQTPNRAQEISLKTSTTGTPRALLEGAEPRTRH